MHLPLLLFALSGALVPLQPGGEGEGPALSQAGDAYVFDFTRCPPGGVQLVGATSHCMVPEAEGPSNWTFEAGVLTSPAGWDSVVTPAGYQDCRMHVEFNVHPAGDKPREARGNSGVYIQQRYEIQILDSADIAPGDYQDSDCGSVYRLKAPDRPSCRPAGAWQSYDIVFRAARFDGEEKLADARITVFQNGYLIHEDVAISRKTGAGQPEGADARPLKLQGHNNPVGFRNVWIEPLSLDAMPALPAADPRRLAKRLPRPGEVLAIDGRVAFVLEPKQRPAGGAQPWVWYAPTLPGLPGDEEGWMLDRLLDAGVAVAGIDVGESQGGAEGVRHYEAFYRYLTSVRGYAARPVLLARSRGGPMLYGWATEHPDSVAGVAGIYPICDLPAERLGPLAQARVPILHLHGDQDSVVPLETHSAALAARYRALGGPIEVEVVAGRGHDMWSGWFESESLAGFAIERARVGATAASDEAQEPPGTERRAAPVKVYILSGQSNMVGIGQVDGRSTRFGDEFKDPVVSVYSGAYAPDADYSSMEAIVTESLPSYGGTEPTPFPRLEPAPPSGGVTYVVRGEIVTPERGAYEFRPGYDESSYCAMRVGDVEVHRRAVGGEPRRVSVDLEAGRAYPFEVLFFTEAADGLGWLLRADVPGTLTTVVKREGRFPELLGEDGAWAVRDDVWYKGLVTATADTALTVGCGSGAGTIGPELQFGHVLGNHHDEPVLVLKASQGNRSIGWDYLPPGSERFTFEGRIYAGYGDKVPSWTQDDPGKEVNWYAGLQYDQCFDAVDDVLERFDECFPQFGGRGYEVAGFVWWQGHKDGNAAHASRYEQNLVHLIRSLRARYEVPLAPFVIGTIGFGGWALSGHHLTVANAQLAVSGTSGRYPEFAGNVLTVETRDFWVPAERSPRNQDFHYNGNAETYLRVGGALGRGMIELLEARDGAERR